MNVISYVRSSRAYELKCRGGDGQPIQILIMQKAGEGPRDFGRRFSKDIMKQDIGEALLLSCAYISHSVFRVYNEALW